MVWTIDRTNGTDLLINTGIVFGPAAGTRIYAPGSVNPVTDINVTGHTWLTMPANEVGTLNGDGATDRLITGSTNDLVIWDAATIHDLLFHDLTVFGRARLPFASEAVRLEIFELGAGNDVLNLTALDADLPTGNSPGTYNWAVTAYGGDGNDVMAAGEAGDILVGDANDGMSSSGVRSDTIWGFGGNDTIFGDDGSSAIDEAVGGADTLYGGAGNDLVYGEGGDDYIEGQSGSDTLYGGAGNDLIYGEDPSGVDLISNFPDTLYGGAGNDTVYGGVGGDLIFGDAGADRLFGGLGDDSIVGGAGNDTLFGEAGSDTLDGGVGPDLLFGGDGADFIRGGAGGASLVDTLYGGAGNDTLQLDPDLILPDGELRAWDGSSAAAILIGFDGAANVSPDLFFGDAGFDTLLLNNGTDVLTGWDGDVKGGTLVYGNGGNQRLTGVELVLAGGGADFILLNHLSTGGGDPSRIFSESITIAGMGGDDTVFSGSGNDVLWGDALGNGTGAPGDGNDFLVGGAGNDTLFGAGGNDVLYTGGLAQADPLSSNTAFGGDGNDTIYGGAGADSLFGGAGDDLIFDAGSSSANNTVSGGAGADVLVLEVSSHATPFAISAGPNDLTDGDDRVFVFGAYQTVTATLGAGNDTYISEPVLRVGASQVDIVAGQMGDDVISTWFGDDEITGGQGNDALWGGAGSDTIYGGPGSDYLYGGEGNGDVLVGGAGVDYYYWSRIDGNDLIDDADPNALPGQQSENYIVVFPAGDPNETGPNADWLLDGTGVFEIDHDLYDNDGNDMVQLVDLDGAGPGTMHELRILQGAGAGSVLTFDQTEISAIALWNNDATTGTPVITVYAWDEDAGRYLYQG